MNDIPKIKIESFVTEKELDTLSKKPIKVPKEIFEYKRFAKTSKSFHLTAKYVLDQVWSVLMSNLYNPKLQNEEEKHHLVGRWLLKKYFIEDLEVTYVDDHVLERIDMNMPIGPDNIRWVTKEECKNPLIYNYHLPILIKRVETKHRLIDANNAKYTYSNGIGLYRCFCGNSFKANMTDINGNKIRSCGCMRSLHNIGSYPTYNTWYGMIRRCYDSYRKDYKFYGGRGISVCDRWLNYLNFYKDMEVPENKKLTIDKIDNNKGYCNDNCRWATMSLQKANSRSVRQMRGEYRGVVASGNKYLTHLKHNKVHMRIGRYDTEEEAAIAFDRYVIKNKLPHLTNGLYTKEMAKKDGLI